LNYSDLEYYVSQPRLNRYLMACGNSKFKAQKLYKINLRVAQAFYPMMNLFEIFIRNAINYQIANYFDDLDWILTEKDGFMSNGLLAPSNYFLRESVSKAERFVKGRGNLVTSGKIIAEQTLGFWTALFDSHHFLLLKGIPLKTFAYKPVMANRSILAAKFKDIREFRNRIYHNEPICFRGGVVDFSTAIKVMNDMRDIISWINPGLLNYTEYFNNITTKISTANDL